VRVCQPSVHPRHWGGNSPEGSSCQGRLELHARSLRTDGQRPKEALPGVPLTWRAQGRHKAGTCGVLMGLEERGLTKSFRMGTRHQCRHTVDEGCCRRGGVAGAEPPHKGGRLRPTAQKSGSQWLVVSCQRRRFICLRVERGMARFCRCQRITWNSPVPGCIPSRRRLSFCVRTEI